MQPTDQGSVSAALRGDRDAFGSLVAQYRHQVYGLCWDRLRDRADAEDAAQDTFLSAFQKLDTLREPGKFGAWLRTIATNVCRMRIRRRKLEAEHRDASTRDTDLEGCPADPQPALTATVDDALSSLPDAQRVPFVLRHIDGLSYDEIADFMSTESSTIRGRIHTAKKRLREDMTDMAAKQIRKQRLSPGFTKAVTKSLFWHEQPIRIEEEIGPDDVCFLFLDLHSAPSVTIEGTRSRKLAVTGRKVLFGETEDEARSRATQVKAEVARRKDVYRSGPRQAELFHGVSWRGTRASLEGHKRAPAPSAHPVYEDTATYWEELKSRLAGYPDTQAALADGLSSEVVELTMCSDKLAPIWIPRSRISKTRGLAGVAGHHGSGPLFASAGGAELSIKLPACRLLVIVADSKPSLHLSGIRSNVLMIADGYGTLVAERIVGDLHVFNCIPGRLTDIAGDLHLHVPYYGGGSCYPKGATSRMGWQKRTIIVDGVKGAVWASVRSLDIDLTCTGTSADVETTFGDLRVTLPKVDTSSQYVFQSTTGTIDIRMTCPWPDDWHAALWTEGGSLPIRPLRLLPQRFRYGVGCPECLYQGNREWSERHTCSLQASSSLGDVRFTHRIPKAK